VTPRWRRATGAAWALGLGLGLAACAPDLAEYDAAVARMNALELRVDQAFDEVRDLNEKLFVPEAWDDPGALAALVEQADGRMAEVLATQDRRIATEEAILTLEVMRNAAGTRVLYQMDLQAQAAKREVFVERRAMYAALAEAVRAGDPGAYAEAGRVHGERIEQANARYRELDLARQRRQRAASGGRRRRPNLTARGRGDRVSPIPKGPTEQGRCRPAV
jgi:hypothetical protein